MIILFEKYKQEPEINDFVLTRNVSLRDLYLPDDNLENYIKNNIGFIIDIKYEHNSENKYLIKYLNVPGYIIYNVNLIGEKTNLFKKTFEIHLYRSELTYWNKDYTNVKNKLNIILTTNKYNL